MRGGGPSPATGTAGSPPTVPRARRDPGANGVLTLGETCVLMDPIGDGGAEIGTTFQMRVSGSESNVAVALCRLGVRARWVSRLGEGPMGDLVIRTLAGEALDLAYVRRDADAPTGVTFKLRRQGSTSLVYYRRHSAASRMEPSDVPDDAFEGVRLVHLSGITMALGAGPRATLRSVVDRARDRGLCVTLDLNYRPALWTPAQASAAYREVLPRVDWVLCGEDEGRVLFGGDDAESVMQRVMVAGASRVVVRIGAEGALVPDGGRIVRVPARLVAHVVDEIGAGDAFDAGFLYGLLQDWDPEPCVIMGNLLASFALSGSGDWETLPSLHQIHSELPGPVVTPSKPRSNA